MINWAWEGADKYELSEESIELIGTMISWFFTSSNRYLRDSATKAFVTIFRSRISFLPKVTQKFLTIDDPYVLERIFAGAYGAVLRSENLNGLKELSEFIYQEVFDKDIVYQHVLLRDYARQIIELTSENGIELDIDIERVKPPYSSESLPDNFPTIEEIDSWYNPENEISRQLAGTNSILRSMTTEYGRGTSGYGDFGRYTFQSAFSNFKIDVNGLSNYAVQQISEKGYSNKLFSEFDLAQPSIRGETKKERIGKKYQWIVFHELLAKVSDQVELYDEAAGLYDEATTNFDGPWYPNVRDIDPSILISKTESEWPFKEQNHWSFIKNYANWNIDDKDWVKNIQDLPNPEDIIQVKDSDGENWLWLEIKPAWDEPLEIDEVEFDARKKRLFYLIQGFLINKGEFESFYQNYFNIRFPETRSLTSVFSREYFWSPAFYFHNRHYYNGEKWVEVHEEDEGVYVGMVHRPTEYFLWEEEFDCSKESTIAFSKPSEELFYGLSMQFSENEGELLDHDGNLICLDPSVNNKSQQGLLIKKQPFLEYLDQNNLTIIWPILGEKIIAGGGVKPHDVYPGRQNIKGFYYLDNGEIFSEFEG